MFDFFFDVPLVISGPLTIGALCLFGIAGLPLVRRFVLPRLRIHHEDAHFSGAMVHSVMVFYGLAVTLIHTKSLRSSLTTTKAYSRSKPMVGTTNKSIAAICGA